MGCSRQAGAGRSPPVQTKGSDKAGAQDGGTRLDSDGRCGDSEYRVGWCMRHRKVMWVVAGSGVPSYRLFTYLGSPKESALRSTNTPPHIICFISLQP